MTLHKAFGQAWLLLLLAGLLLGCPKSEPPPVVLVPRSVDGAAAMALVEQLTAIGPRPAGSLALARTTEFIADACRQAGAVVSLDRWQDSTPHGALALCNVIAEIPGDRPGMILLASHYDTKHLEDHPTFAGANDAASSTGLLITMIRQLAAPGYWHGPTLRCVFFDGEEARVAYGPADGLHGSRREAARIVAAKEKCHAMILMDMIGDRDLQVTFPPDSNRALVRLAFAAAESLGSRSHFGHYTRGSLLDDHTPFVERGIPAIDFIDFNYGPANRWWHTKEDTVDKLSPASLETVGNTILAMLVQLAANPDLN